MICKVRRTIEKYGMALSGRTVVAGVSGGADSMALMNVLNTLKDEMNFDIIVCHVNHSIRGNDADRDEEFVRGECERLGMRFEAVHADVPLLARRTGAGLEECGRKVRYEAFSSFGDCLIATAHTLSDKSETLLLNIARGASVKGLCSIPAVRGNIIRPLIDCTREEIEKYCEENGISYVTDATNFDENYSRNRIRLNVIPEMKKLNPSFGQAVLRLTESAAADEDYFRAEVKKVVSAAEKDGSYSADALSELHPALRHRAISEILKAQAGITPETVHIKMVEDILSGGRTMILGDTAAEVKNRRLVINPVPDEYFPWECDFSTFYAETPVGKIKGEIFNKNDLPPKQIVHNRVLDFDAIVGKCVIRNRRAGDRMKVAGSSCTKTLKKLFSERHFENRGSLPVLCDDEGILWVSGIGCADRCKIKMETVKIVYIGEVKND